MSFYCLIPQLAKTMELFTQLGSQFAERRSAQVRNYQQLTEKYISLMHWESLTTFATSLGASATGFASALHPENSLERAAFQTASTFLQAAGQGSGKLFQGAATRRESERMITSQIGFQTAQHGENESQEAVNNANRTATKLMELFHSK